MDNIDVIIPNLRKMFTTDGNSILNRNLSAVIVRKIEEEKDKVE